jgi:ASC-1-like (ASCH) protein
MEEFNIQGRYFYDLHNPLVKTGEGRGINSRLAQKKIGDIVKFWQINNEGVKVKYTAKIIAKDVYPNIRVLLQTVGVNKMLPDVFDLDQGVKMYTEKFNVGTGEAVNLRFEILSPIENY